MKACKQCHLIVEEGEVCPQCKGALSREWQGYAIIIDCTRSDIARQIGVKQNGKYALKVR
ncbi:MAG: DNA-directed RNA polymerase subunit E [Euryarchaeota archaeon]|nr:DNA-directed RNA polymerase subunit E [Euryarchaeota archaeon]